MKNGLKRGLKAAGCIVLSAVLALTGIQLPGRGLAEKGTGVAVAKATTTLDSLMRQYVGTEWNNSYQGAIQCKGFGAMIWNKLYGVRYIGNYDSQKYYIPNVSGGYEIGRLNFNQMSQAASTALLKKGQAGDFIQVRRRGKTWGHSMIYVSQYSWIFRLK